MEITLWIIIYLAFVLPVAKCYSLYHNTPEEDCLPIGIFWPVIMIGFIFWPVGMVIEFVGKSLLNLIKD